MHRVQKLESPIRLEELNPTETLKKIGVKQDQTICDIGAGSGIFTIPASSLAKEVYALEISNDMLDLIREKVKNEGIHNIELVKVEDDSFNMKANSVDIAIAVTVLHEIKNKSAFLDEIKRMLKPEGKAAVIEFHKRNTPIGPTVDRRLGNESVKELFHASGFTICNEFNLGENFYCVVFEV
jgi:ubiquinone/menaquinone biosynthesis C-methylase UbiE